MVSDPIARAARCFVEFREGRSYYNHKYGRWQDRVVVEEASDKVIARYLLHENNIATLVKYRSKDMYELTLWHCGYPTPTTFSRLRLIAHELSEKLSKKFSYRFFLYFYVDGGYPIMCVVVYRDECYFSNSCFEELLRRCILFDKPVRISIGGELKIVGKYLEVVNVGSDKLIRCLRYKRRKVCIDKLGNAYTKLSKNFMVLNRKLTEELKDKIAVIILSYDRGD